MTISITVLAYLLTRVTEMQERPFWPREGHITVRLQDVESGDAIYEVCKLCSLAVCGLPQRDLSEVRSPFLTTLFSSIS